MGDFCGFKTSSAALRNAGYSLQRPFDLYRLFNVAAGQDKFL